MFQILETHTSIHMLAHEIHLCIGVCLNVIAGLLGTDFLIILRDENVALYASADRDALIVLRLGSKDKQAG